MSLDRIAARLSRCRSSTIARSLSPHDRRIGDAAPAASRTTMPDDEATPLLAADEALPVLVENPDGPSPFVLTCDHAGHLIPRGLGSLGLSDTDLQRHIGWDIGILGVSRRLSEALGAPLVGQLYSRLVIDCNREPGIAPS